MCSARDAAQAGRLTCAPSIVTRCPRSALLCSGCGAHGVRDRHRCRSCLGCTLCRQSWSRGAAPSARPKGGNESRRSRRHLKGPSRRSPMPRIGKPQACRVPASRSRAAARTDHPTVTAVSAIEKDRSRPFVPSTNTPARQRPQSCREMVPTSRGDWG